MSESAKWHEYLAEAQETIRRLGIEQVTNEGYIDTQGRRIVALVAELAEAQEERDAALALVRVMEAQLNQVMAIKIEAAKSLRPRREPGK